MSQYGVTFAEKLIQHGDYEQALVEAGKHAEREPESPEPFYDRARALSALGRYEEAVAAYARAIALDALDPLLPDGDADNGLFSTVIAWGQSLGDEAARLAALARYGEILPKGAHQEEAAQWALRFRGLLPTPFVKPRD